MSEKYCPTQGGNFSAYEPEYLEGDEWHRIPTSIVPARSGRGIPAPMLTGGVASTIGLCGHEQAQAIAWGYAAECAARGKTVEVRVVEYKIIYDIKAERIKP